MWPSSRSAPRLGIGPDPHFARTAAPDAPAWCVRRRGARRTAHARAPASRPSPSACARTKYLPRRPMTMRSASTERGMFRSSSAGSPLRVTTATSRTVPRSSTITRASATSREGSSLRSTSGSAASRLERKVLEAAVALLGETQAGGTSAPGRSLLWSRVDSFPIARNFGGGLASFSGAMPPTARPGNLRVPRSCGAAPPATARGVHAVADSRGRSRFSHWQRFQPRTSVQALESSDTGARAFGERLRETPIDGRDGGHARPSVPARSL
jgi:hypothetical protein